MEDKKTNETLLQSPPPAAGTTPDYAAGLAATPTYAPQTPQPISSSSKFSSHAVYNVIVHRLLVIVW